AVRHARSALGRTRDPRRRQRPSEAGVRRARSRLRPTRARDRRIHPRDRRSLGSRRRALRWPDGRVPRRHGRAAPNPAAAAADLGRRQLARGRAAGLTLAILLVACRHDVDVGTPLPGVPPFDAALVAKLAAARRAGESPHTRHLRPDGTPLYTNRLALESSPYLRQHAHNPVDWHPWSDEAFDTARRLERPVLLSVGYSTCHWCHVTEEESFEDEEIARYLNEHYVAIKVDREERPDVDSLYMTAVQTMSGSGGWPMTVWLTPERQPFYGGTYFPPRDGERGARAGFLTLLKKLRDAFDRDPLRVADAAADVAERVRQSLGPTPS